MSFGMKMAADELLATLLTSSTDIVAIARTLGATALGREILKNTAIRAEMYLAATVNTNTTGAVTSQLGGIVQIISQFMH
jgi:hypothetical protein